jgi:raffinose/stachyose/melibiose transport system substrate-binding protein
VKKNKIIGFGLAAVLATSLVGCSSSNSSDSSSSAGKNTLNWWIWGAPTDTYAKQIVSDFEKANPGVKIQIKNLAQNYANGLKVAMQGGTGPDIVSLQVGGQIEQYKDYLQPLQDMEAKAMPDYKDKYIQLGLDQATIDGNLYALPVGYSAESFVEYNKTLLDKFGVTPPTNLDELKAAIKKIESKDPNVVPFVFGAKDTWIDLDVFNVLSQQASPGYIYKVDKGEAKWTDPEMVKAAKLWKSMFTDGIFEKGAVGLGTYPDAQQMFQQGKAAMWVTGSWEAHSMKPADKDAAKFKGDLGFVPLPNMVNGTDHPVVAAADMTVGINKNAKNKDAALKFINYLTNGEGQTTYMQSLEMVPAVKGVEVKTDQLKAQSEKDSLKVLQDAVANNVGNRFISNPKVQDALGKALQNIGSGAQTPEQAMADVQKAAEAK